VEAGMIVRGGVLHHEFVVAGFDRVACDLCDERRHRHFDVELDHVGDGMELNVHDLVLEGHEADEH